MFNKIKASMTLLIAMSTTCLLSVDSAFINNKTTQDIEVIFKYEGHGKTEEVKKTLKPNESKEYVQYIPGCSLTRITCSTISNITSNKQTFVIKDNYGTFNISFVNGVLTATPSNN